MIVGNMDADEDLRLLRLRAEGATYDEIGRKFTITRQAAHKEAGVHLSGEGIRMFRIVGKRLEVAVSIHGEMRWIKDGGDGVP